MSIIFIPDTETGELVGVESNDDVAVHAVDGQGKYIGLVTLTQGITWSPTPPPPGEWTWNGANWIRDAATLDELKILKWAEIKGARALAIDDPLVTPYGAFDCDPTAVLILLMPC